MNEEKPKVLCYIDEPRTDLKSIVALLALSVSAEVRAMDGVAVRDVSVPTTDYTSLERRVMRGFSPATVSRKKTKSLERLLRK